MQILFIVLLIGYVTCAPVDEISTDCAACQMAAHLFRLDRTVIEGQEHLASPSAVAKRCNILPNCQKVLTHCQIVSTLSTVDLKLPGEGLNGSEIYFRNIHNSLNAIFDMAKQCDSNPNTIILDSSPSKTQCQLCILIYNFFKMLNNTLMDQPLLQNIEDAINLTCILVAGLTKLTPAYCPALLGYPALPAIVRGIQDSLGSFYDLIAVQGMHCPPYQQLFGQCAQN